MPLWTVMTRPESSQKHRLSWHPSKAVADERLRHDALEGPHVQTYL